MKFMRHMSTWICSGTLAFIFLVSGQTFVQASSHREAPFVTEHPKVDGTDFYMFNSYEAGRSAFVTMVANYGPLQDAFGGPNYFTMDPNALYEIHIDNVGDAHEHLTFQFRFTNTLVNGTGVSLNIGGKTVPIALRFAGGISAGDSTKLGETETYTVKVVRGNRRTGAVSDVTNAADGSKVFTKPFDYVGDKTFTNAAGYTAYANQYIYNINIPGCSTAAKMFVGQRQDPFFIALGQTFDLVNFNPLGGAGAGTNKIAAKNVTAIELEVPAACLVAGNSTIIGGWTTASLRQAELLRPTPTYSSPGKFGGPWIQVSRLGMPLVDELIIGLPDKNNWNFSQPKDDAQFATYVTNPTFPALLQALFGVTAPTTPRNDLVTVFLTGVPGVNQPSNVVGAEELRLNTAIPATAQGAQNTLGAAQCFNRSTTVNTGLAGCDPAGYPNGRRPGDDAVDITLRVAMGVLDDATSAPSGALAYTDGAPISAMSFLAAFPYLNIPTSGSPL